jgi:hypothetical protein
MLSETAKSTRVSNVAPTGWATEGRKFYDWTGMCFRRFGWRKGEEGEGWSGRDGVYGVCGERKTRGLNHRNLVGNPSRSHIHVSMLFPGPFAILAAVQEQQQAAETPTGRNLTQAKAESGQGRACRLSTLPALSLTKHLLTFTPRHTLSQSHSRTPPFDAVFFLL